MGAKAVISILVAFVITHHMRGENKENPGTSTRDSRMRC